MAFIGSATPELTMERIAGPWNRIEALEPLCILDPNRGIELASGNDVFKWIDQSPNNFIFQNDPSTQPVFQEIGATPSGAPAIVSAVSAALYLRCTSSVLIAPFQGDGDFEVFHAYIHTNNNDTQRFWSVSDNDAPALESITERATVNSLTKRIEVNGTGSASKTRNAIALTTPIWTHSRATAGVNYGYEIRDVTGGTTSITTRGTGYNVFTLFARTTNVDSLHNFSDHEMYALVVFDRILRPDERSTMTDALDEIMGLGY